MGNGYFLNPEIRNDIPNANRQKYIKNLLETNLDIIGNVNEDNINSYDFRFQNNSKFPIKLIDIYTTNEKIRTFENKILMPGFEINIFEKDMKNTSIRNLNYSYMIYGIKNQKKEGIIIPRSFSSRMVLSDIWSFVIGHALRPITNPFGSAITK